jgi:hypothetical protein
MFKNKKHSTLIALFVVLIAFFAFGYLYNLDTSRANQSVNYDGQYVPNPKAGLHNTVINRLKDEEQRIAYKDIRMNELIGHKGGKYGYLSKGDLIMYNKYKDILWFKDDTNVFSADFNWNHIIERPKRLDASEFGYFTVSENDIALGEYTGPNDDVYLVTLAGKNMDLDFTNEITLKLRLNKPNNTYRAFTSKNGTSWKMIDAVQVDNNGYVNIKTKNLSHYVSLFPMDINDFNNRERRIAQSTAGKASSLKNNSYCDSLFSANSTLSSEDKVSLYNKKVPYRELVHELVVRYNEEFDTASVENAGLPYTCTTGSNHFKPFFKKARLENFLSRRCNPVQIATKYQTFLSILKASKVDKELSLNNSLYKALFSLITSEDRANAGVFSVEKYKQSVGGMCMMAEMIDNLEPEGLEEILTVHYQEMKAEYIKNKVEENRRAKNNERTAPDGSITTAYECNDTICFEEKFNTCDPATVVINENSNLSYFYEILGLDQGLCKVRFKYINVDNSEFQNIDMTCAYDNAKQFQVSVSEVIGSWSTDEELGSCSGDLYEKLKN